MGTYPGVSRGFQWKSCGCVDRSIPISGVKQLGALTALVKNYSQNIFIILTHVFRYISFFFPIDFFTSDDSRVSHRFTERKYVYIIAYVVYSFAVLTEKDLLTILDIPASRTLFSEIYFDVHTNRDNALLPKR